MEKNDFERKVAPLLQNIGLIGAGVTCIAYVIIVIILVIGFKAETLLQISTFAITNAIVGLIIMQMLKYQGTVFAKDIPENKELLKKYYNTKTKDKKPRSMNYYWLTSVTKDVFVKGITLAGTSIGLVSIVIEGSKDYKLLLLAFANLIMFICFGLLGLNSAYEFFNNEFIPYVKAKLLEAEQEKNDNLVKNVERPQEGEKQNA